MVVIMERKEKSKFANKDPRFARRIAMLGKNISFDGPPKTWTSQRSIEASKASRTCPTENNQNFEEA